MLQERVRLTLSRRSAEKCHALDGTIHSARVTIAVIPSNLSTVVIPSETAIQQIRTYFRDDFDFGLHCVLSAIDCQIAIANAAGDFPFVDEMNFQVVVETVELTQGMTKELFGILVGVAGMDAIAEYLWDVEREMRRVNQQDGVLCPME